MLDKPFIFILIGAGGIGGNVCRDLPKLLIDTKHRILLIDGDMVEEKNCKRQPFQNQDIQLNKARVLARKINSFYDVKCKYYDSYITNQELDTIVNTNEGYIPFFIGSVDNDATRKLIEMAFYKCDDAVYIDGANSEFEGNVYVSYKEDGIKHGKTRSEVYELSNDINPGLAGCENQVARGETQYLITNNRIAASILEHIFPFLIQEEKKYEGVTVIERFKTIHY